MTQPGSGAYRSDIDGLRAIAVIPVLFFHAGFSAFSGGFIGVDIFFVISGYLITGILQRELDYGSFSFIGFYDRRIRRILPALLLVMMACVPAAWWLMAPFQLESFGKSLLAVMLFVSNVLFWSEDTYFGGLSEEKPLLHTWSLAVEEQYYLLFPLALLLLYKITPHWMRLVAIALTALTSFVLADWASTTHASAAFYLSPTRAWELLAGSLCASAPRFAGHRRLRNLLCLVSLLSIAGCFVIYSANTPFPGRYALVPVTATAILLVCVDDRLMMGRLLSMRALTYTGLVSYSLYLWHQPLFAFARIIFDGDVSPVLYMVLMAIAFLAAMLTRRFVEIPVRNRQIVSRQYLAAGVLSASAVMMAFGVAADRSDGWVNRLPVVDRQLLEYERYDAARIYREGECFLTPEQTQSVFSDTCFDAIEHTDYLLWGDSHAAALYPGIHTLVQAQGLQLAQLTASGCPPVFDYLLTDNPNCLGVVEYVRKRLPQFNGMLILQANWSQYFQDRAFEGKLITTLQTLSALGIPVKLLGNVPRWTPSLPQQLTSQLTSEQKNSSTDARYLIRTPLVAAMFSNDSYLKQLTLNAGLSFVSLLDAICTAPAGPCLAALRNDSGTLVPIIWDDAHLTREGSDVLINTIQGQFSNE